MDVRKNGAWVSPTSAEVYYAGAWRTISYGEAYYNGAWRQIVSFAAPYTALTINPASPSASSTTSDTITSPTVQAIPTGGLSPFTYAWTLVSSSGLTGITITTPTRAGTTVTATISPGGEGTSGSAVVRCTATDALGTAKTANVTIGFSHDSSTGTA
jgi:hypothetical protein